MNDTGLSAACSASPACGRGRRARRARRVRALAAQGRPQFSVPARRHPLPSPPPQAGEGAYCRCGRILPAIRDRTAFARGPRPVGQNTQYSVKPLPRKYSTLPKFGFGVCVAHPGSTRRGDLEVVLIASRACGGRGSVGMRGAGRAGSPCEPDTRVQTNGAVQFVAPIFDGYVHDAVDPVVRTNARTAKPCGPGRRCYGQAGSKMCASPTGWTASSIRPAREARRKVRLPGEHGISRPTIAQGRPSDRHHLYAAVRFFLRVHFRAADRGCVVSTRPSLRPLGFQRREDEAKLGRIAPRGRRGVSVNRAACHNLDLVGWAKRSVPTRLSPHLKDRGHGASAPLPTLRHRRWDVHRSIAMTQRICATHHSRAPDAAQRPRRCEASSGTVRCRAGAHVAALCRVALGRELQRLPCVSRRGND